MGGSRVWRRPREGRWVAGICAGLADRLGWRVGPIRVIFLVGSLIPVLPGLPLYLLLWLLVPGETEESGPPPSYGS